MVSTTDVKFYKSSNNALGGPITGTEIKSGESNNLFINVKKSDQDGGADFYHCMYLKNTHASEDMDKFNFWLGTDTFQAGTTVYWGFENTTIGGYNFAPFFTSTGSNTDETGDAATYDLTQFTLAAWFSIPAGTLTTQGWLVNKGGSGSDTAGQNLNYGLWIESNGTVRGGFEETTGTDHYAQSPLSYDDDSWHFALVYYDGTTVNLYVDNMTTAVATHATTTTPETNALPIRINQNSRVVADWLPINSTIDEVRIWNRGMTSSTERNDLLLNTVNTSGLVFEKSFGTSTGGIVAQEIANVGDEPVGITWIPAGVEPSTPNIGQLNHGQYIPIWVWWHIEANALAGIDDTAIFNFTFFITSSGSGDPGTGGEGTVTIDDFGVRKIYATKTGGRVYNSNWHTATTHQWDGTSGQDFDNLDPQDPMADLVCPATNRAKVDADLKVLIATTNADKNSWRYYVKDPGDDATSSTWKWSESLEITVYYKAISDYSGGSIHVHCRIMGPTEHWLALNTCSGAGHEYSYEIKKNLVNQFRKEEFHVEPDSGYCNNIEFQDQTAPYNQWIGMKLVTKKQSSTSMKIEAWKDTTDGLNGGTWVKKGDMLDDGTNWKLPSQADIDNYTSLPAGTGNCAKIPTMDQALTMTASAVGLRVDNTLVHFKKFSVREIDPDDVGSGGGTGGGGGGGGNPPPATTEWSMAFIGDEGCGSTTNKVRDQCKDYDYTVSVGDHAYASASCWTSTFSPLKPNFNGAYGNHEYSESGGIAPYKTFFGHDKTYFSFNFQNVHILVLDSNASKIDNDPGSAQYVFATNDLTAAFNNSAIDWIFVVWHHPMFGSTSSHSYNDGNMTTNYHKLCTDHKVAFVFTGHNHNWQRSKKVAFNSGSPTNPTVISGTSPYANDTTGLIHVVTGTSGHDTGSALYSLSSQPSFQAYQNRTHNGIYEVLASNNGKTLTCSFVDIDGSKFDTITYTTT
jgi:predicted phosphodiesterase